MDDVLLIHYDLANRREVAIIASQMRRSRFEIVGYLVAIWGWFTREAPSGYVQIDVATLADLLGIPKRFLDCLLSVGWLIEENNTLAVPNWDRYLSEDAKARWAAAYYQRHRRKRSRDAGTSNNCRTIVRHLYNDDDDVRTNEKGKGGVGGKEKTPPSTSNNCQTNDRQNFDTTEATPDTIRSLFRHHAKAWGPSGPRTKRDRALLWRVCHLATQHTWAHAALEQLAHARPRNPGAYLQKLAMTLAPPEPNIAIILAKIPLPDDLTKDPAPTPKKNHDEEKNETPLTPEEARELMRELIATCSTKKTNHPNPALSAHTQ